MFYYISQWMLSCKIDMAELNHKNIFNTSPFSHVHSEPSPE